jgi:hypothetical protein
VRWAQLFADLDAQFDAVEAAELAAEVTDRTRRELALLRLVDRLGPSIGGSVTVRLLGAGAIEGQLTGLGVDWLLLAEPAGREALVATSSLLSVSGLTAHTATPDSQGVLFGRLNLPYALRGVARDRSAVALTLVDGSTAAGTVDRVGADFLELAEHPPGEARRRDAVRDVRTFPLAAVALVRRY